MSSLTTTPSLALLLVTKVNRWVALGHHGAHQSRTAGHVGTGNTLLIARSAQRGHGKHRTAK